MGKGFDPEQIEALEGPVLVAGKCAIEEVSAKLTRRLGKSRVYMSGECNDLRATTEAMCHLMKVNPLRLVPLDLVSVLSIISRAYLKRTHARAVNPACSFIKMR